MKKTILRWILAVVLIAFAILAIKQGLYYGELDKALQIEKYGSFTPGSETSMLTPGQYIAQVVLMLGGSTAFGIGFLALLYATILRDETSDYEYYRCSVETKDMYLVAGFMLKKHSKKSVQERVKAAFKEHKKFMTYDGVYLPLTKCDELNDSNTEVIFRESARGTFVRLE